MESDAQSGRRLVAVAITCEAALGVVALGVGWFLARPPLDQIRWTATGVGYGLAATAPLVGGLIVTVWLPFGPLSRLEGVVRELVTPLFASATVWELLAISAVAGWGEEMLFRGLIQSGIEQFSGRPWLAVAIASIAFGGAHPITRTYAVMATVIGVYLGWLLLATDNLLVPMIAHGAYDFVALAYFLRGEKPQASAAESNGGY